jgi:hypothetical protein
MNKVVGIATDDGTEWHVRSVIGDYDTLCGLDANDPAIGHAGLVTAKRGQKVTCEQCKGLWEGLTALRLRASNFE